jgi:hypothetical protein
MKIDEFIKNSNYSKKIKKGGIVFLLDRWQEIIKDIPYNVDYQFDEYLNDISIRNIIQNIQENCFLNVGLTKRLYELDNCFKEKTIAIDNCLWGIGEIKQKYNKIQHWYYFRIPRESIRNWLSFYMSP